MEYHNKMYQSMINRSFIVILYIVDFSQVNPFSKYDDRNIPFLHKYNQGSYKKSKMVHSIHTFHSNLGKSCKFKSEKKQTV